MAQPTLTSINPVPKNPSFLSMIQGDEILNNAIFIIVITLQSIIQTEEQTNNYKKSQWTINIIL